MLHKGARLRNKRFFIFLSVCLSFLLLLLLLLFCVLRRVGQCSGNASGVNHVLEKKTKHTHENERGSSTRVSLKRK